MPRIADDSLKNETGIYYTSKKANSIYSGEGVSTLIREIENNTELSAEEKAKQIAEIKSKQTVQNIKIRVPIAWKEKIEKRAEEYPKVNKFGKHSVNTYICDLIANDLGIENNAD